MLGPPHRWPTSSRCSRLTARTSDVRSAGSRNPGCSCARVTGEPITADGARASGPPERGLFEYAYKVEQGKLMIQVGDMPTPGAPGGKPGCQDERPHQYL